MPAQRTSKGFKDISLSFKYNPLTYDLIAITNETAIARSVRNIVQTYIGEKVFIAQYGSRLPRFIFDNMDTIDAEIISIEIERTLEQYEPRVTLNSVNVYPNYDTYELDVSINYDITGISRTAQELTFALQPSRR